MKTRAVFLATILLLLVASFLASLSLGANATAPGTVAHALFGFDPDNYDHFAIVTQRLPRALIAIHVGAVIACGGAVLQGLTRNPLASPSTLGLNAGATLFVVAGAFLLDLSMAALGVAALAGSLFGFASCLVVSRLSGGPGEGRGLSLILSGVLVSMLFGGLTQAILLSDLSRRMDFLGWVAGNINQAYADRLLTFWWVGLGALVVLQILARPLMLITLGADKAASLGVNARRVSQVALAAVVLGVGSAVAICGPMGFVGLIVPHLVRPFIGGRSAIWLPACAVTGATVCLLADLAARQAFSPFVLHTGVLMDLLGGLAFIVIVKRFYLRNRLEARA